MDKLFSIFSSKEDNKSDNNSNKSIDKKRRNIISDRNSQVTRNRTRSKSVSSSSNVNRIEKKTEDRLDTISIPLYNNNNNIKLSDSIDCLRNQDYKKKFFNYDMIKSIGWWPNEILEFIEINRLHYFKFIQYFEMNASIFDISLRNAIYFMNHPPYCNLGDIPKFLQHRTTNISDNYWNKVIEEDNCYMEGIEDRNRSDHENQHYYLLKALISLMNNDDISIDDLNLKNEYYNNIYLFIGLYHLKNMSAMIDNMFRKILYSSLNNDDTTGLFIPKIIFDLSNEIKYKVLYYAKLSKHQFFIDISYMFYDLLLYILWKSSLCSQTFIGTNNLHYHLYKKYNKNINNIIDEDFYIKTFSYNSRERIYHVYNTFKRKYNIIQTKQKVILNADNFSELLNSNKVIKNNLISTPKYSSIKDNINTYYITNIDNIK